MQDDLEIWLMFAGAFISVALITALVASAVMKRQRLRERMSGNSIAGDGYLGTGSGETFRRWAAKLTWVDDRMIGFDDADLRSKARLELIHAGYFSPDAAKNYVLVRAALTLLLPVLGYVFVFPIIGNMTSTNQYLSGVGLMILGYLGPDAYMKRRQRSQVEEYRNVFPNLLDLLVVCIDAGTSINAALERVGTDIGYESKALATNVKLLVSEMRSGRSLIDGLDSFAKRVNLPEASSLATLIRQSFELGADIGDALRVYSDEMREKRLSRAEEKANSLPVKLTIPLGLFIFPAILITILTPAVIKIAGTFQAVLHPAH